MNFTKSYDVVVSGGGIAGVAAAVAAAKRGMKTVLLEKTTWTGGLATTGMVYIYLPLCDGNGTQVTFGLAEELLKISLKYGPGDIPANWQKGRNAEEEKRYRAIFSPGSFVLAMEELLESAGVDLWYDTVITGARVDNGRITGVDVANKSGNGTIHGQCFVDATGDADLAHFAGHSCPTATNALAHWVLEYRQGATDHRQLSDNVTMRTFGCNTDSDWSDTSGVNGKFVSEFILAGRRRYREMLSEEYAAVKFNRHTLYPLALPGMAQLRHTRRIHGRFTLGDGMDWQSFGDSVGLAADWRKPGYVWESPYRSMLPEGVGGRIAAGRCISAEKDAWEVTRVIPVAAMTGEVAGVAAALSVKAGVRPDALPYEDLSRELREKCGFPLHFADVGLKGKP